MPPFRSASGLASMMPRQASAWRRREASREASSRVRRARAVRPSAPTRRGIRPARERALGLRLELVDLARVLLRELRCDLGAEPLQLRHHLSVRRMPAGAGHLPSDRARTYSDDLRFHRGGRWKKRFSRFFPFRSFDRPRALALELLGSTTPASGNPRPRRSSPPARALRPPRAAAPRRCRSRGRP